MKKLLALSFSLLMALALLSFFVSAAGGRTEVWVTIADENGKLALVQEKITVSDVDGDGALTINDALYLAHEAKFEGGAKAGYSFSTTAFGVSLEKLWGVANGGSFGYCVNNKSAWSLLDPVQNGDFINAYIYTDLTTWSDTYCYFDVQSVKANAGEKITLTLFASVYDTNLGDMAVVPVKDAILTLNGERTNFKTDSEGKVTFTIASDGEYVISAASDSQILVPPACTATILAIESPQTGDNAFLWIPTLLIVLPFIGGMICFIGKKSKENE